MRAGNQTKSKTAIAKDLTTSRITYRRGWMSGFLVSGLNSFTLTPKQWLEKSQAAGIVSIPESPLADYSFAPYARMFHKLAHEWPFPVERGAGLASVLQQSCHAFEKPGVRGVKHYFFNFLGV